MSRKPTHPQPAADQPSELDMFTPRNLMDLLAIKAAPHLSSADLEAIVRGGISHVEDVADRMATMSEGLGGLIAHDGRGATGQSGNFRDSEGLSQLLFLYGDVLQSIAGVASATGWARDELSTRARK